MKTLLSFAAVVLSLLPCAAQTSGSDSARPDGKRWWQHIKVLADDKLEGRLTGSPGYMKAADYVAAHFKEYGLQPAWKSGYFQPVAFEVQKVVAEKSSAKLSRDGKEQPLSLGEDVLLSARLPQLEQIKAPMVFVGYGLRIPEANFDDFAGQDLKGKIIVYINGGPADISGPLKANARSGQEFYKTIEALGVAGIISIPNPKSMDIPWSRMSLSAGQPGMWIADKEFADLRTPKFAATFNPANADKLLGGSGHTMAELLALADAGKPLPRFALQGELEAKVATERSRVESPNVAGVLPGSDPKLKDEYVVLSAHLDHLGVGRAINGDNIYNGAMDDGSGVASVLEVARMLHESKAKLRRSVIFVAVTAEEKGLLGSRYFAGRPPVPAQALVANINIDMFLPLFPMKLLTIQGLEESSLGRDVEAVAAAQGVRVQRDQEPDRNLFIRSDQYNFIRAGVPALAFKFSGEKGSPEEAKAKQWLTERYHAPSDDLNQPVDLEGAGRFDALMAALASKVANADARPRWNDTSFFKRFAQPRH